MAISLTIDTSIPSKSTQLNVFSMILWQIIMVGPVWDSSCENSWVPVKKKTESDIENAWAFMFNQRVNLKTDSKTLFHSTLKLKYGAFIFKAQQRLKEICIVNNSHNNYHRNYTNGKFLQMHMFRSIDRSLRPTGRIPWINILHLWGFLCIRDAGRRGNKIPDYSENFFYGFLRANL